MHPSRRLLSTFSSQNFRPASYQNTIAAKYRRKLKQHPFLLFGAPFILTMLAGSFFLTPAQALRYETYDRKVQIVGRKEELDMGKDRRKVVDLNEEYYKLAAKDIDDWEQKRAERLPGESDNLWEKNK